MVVVKIYTRTNESGTYYARIVVPKELRSYLKKPAIWRSLSAKRLKEAKENFVVLGVAADNTFQKFARAWLDEADELKVSAVFEEKPLNLDSWLNRVDSVALEEAESSLQKAFIRDVELPKITADSGN